jgi:hypothetical protein
MTTKTRALCVGLLLAAAPLGGCHTGRLRGVIHDDTTGAPIAGAVVASGPLSSTSDEEGFYDLDGLERDETWRIVVSAPGYNLLSTSVVPAPQEDPARVIRDLPLMPLARPAAQPAPRSREPRPEDYLPRHASATPAPGEPDRRLYIKLTEEQSETVLRFVEAHGSEPFSRALRELIESLPRTK